MIQGPCNSAAASYAEVYWAHDLVFRSQQRLESVRPVDHDITLPH